MKSTVYSRMSILSLLAAGTVLNILHTATAPARAADWTNSGGNASRNCLTAELGPIDITTTLWSGGRPSIIAWQPVIEGNRVFMVRELTFPPTSVPNDAYIVAMDLDTGAELWAETLPYNAGDWIPWIGGVKNGRVFASRSGNGGSVAAKLYALDVVTGDILWDSDDTTRAGAYDGVVFAPDGDPILASHVAITRINAEDGATVWNRTRDRAVSGECGGAIFGNALYIDGLAPGGQVIERRDLATGLYMYETPVMPGFTEQNWPMVGPDGTVYVSRTQNNVAVDFFNAFTDTGSALTLKWSIPANWTTTSEFGVGPDGSVYMIAPGRMLSRLNPVNGAVIDDVGPIPNDGGNGLAPRMAIDAAGRVYFSNGQFGSGRVYCFTPNLEEIWSLAVPNVNVGAPAIGANGTLVIAGIGNNVRAYRDATTCNACDADCSGTVDFNDMVPFLNALLGSPSGCSPCQADTNGDTLPNGADVAGFVACLLGP